MEPINPTGTLARDRGELKLVDIFFANISTEYVLLFPLKGGTNIHFLVEKNI